MVRVGSMAAAALLLAGSGLTSARGQEPPPEIRREIEKVRAELERNRAVQAELEAHLRRLVARAEAAAAAQKQGKEKDRTLEQQIRERDIRIAVLTDLLAEARVEAAKKRGEVEVQKAANKELMLEVRRLMLELARLKGQEPPAKKTRAKPNPPPEKLTGKILDVNAKEGGLITISLGSADGLKVGHTLEVYRLKPKPKYLGRVRIVGLQAHRAVAQVELARAPVPLRPGDEVASDLK